MVTTKKAPALSWRVAVSELLESAHISKASLARAVGANRAVTHRHLNGEREGSPKTVKKINQALSRLVANRDVGTYLDAVYAAEKTSHLSEQGAPAVGFTFAFMFVHKYFKDGHLAEIITLMEKWPLERRLRVAHTLAVAFHRRLIRHFDRRVESKIFIDETFEIFASQGFDLTPWLRSAAEVGAMRAQDELRLVVQQALSAITVDLSLRNHWEARITLRLHAFMAAVAPSVLSLSSPSSFEPLSL